MAWVYGTILRQQTEISYRSEDTKRFKNDFQFTVDEYQYKVLIGIMHRRVYMLITYKTAIIKFFFNLRIVLKEERSYKSVKG